MCSRACSVTMAATYFLIYFVIPRYLLRKRYVLFALSFGYTLLASIYLDLIVVVVAFIFIGGLKTTDMDPATLDWFYLVMALFGGAFVGGLTFISNW